MRTRIETDFDPMNQKDELIRIPGRTNVLVVNVWTGTLTNWSSNHWVEVLWDGRKGYVYSLDLEGVDDAIAE